MLKMQLYIVLLATFQSPFLIPPDYPHGYHVLSRRATSAQLFAVGNGGILPTATRGSSSAFTARGDDSADPVRTGLGGPRILALVHLCASLMRVSSSSAPFELLPKCSPKPTPESLDGRSDTIRRGLVRLSMASDSLAGVVLPTAGDPIADSESRDCPLSRLNVELAMLNCVLSVIDESRCWRFGVLQRMGVLGLTALGRREPELRDRRGKPLGLQPGLWLGLGRPVAMATTVRIAGSASFRAVGSGCRAVLGDTDILPAACEYEVG